MCNSPLRTSVSLCLVGLLLGSVNSVSATIVFDDHFTGASGGMPAGWWRVLGSGDVIEAGTTVSMGSAAVAIASEATLDPSAGTVTIVTDFTTIGDQGASGLMAPTSLWDGFIFCAIRLSDGRIEVSTCDREGHGEYRDLTFLGEYAGGPIRMTMVLAPDWFSVTTDAPPFCSGPIAYADAFQYFTRDVLGTAAAVMLFNQDDGAYTVIDRVAVDVWISADVQDEEPAENTTFGRIKALFSR